MLLRLLLILCFMPTVALASVSVSVNGSNYTIPQTNEKGWGTNVTTWIQAISSHTLQNSGGTFTLTGDVDFGASFGLKAPYYISKTANPATTGVLRLSNADSVSWRNTGNSADIALKPDATDGILDYNSIPLVETSATQTLTNKTIAAGSNTITGIADANVSSSAAIARSKLASGSASQVVINDGTGALSSEAQLAMSRGGTNGNLTATQGAVAYSTATSIGLTTVGTSGQFLQSIGAGNPTWATAVTTAGTGLSLSGATLSLSTPVTTANGGTGATLTPSVGGIAYGSSTTAIGITAAGTAGQILLSGGVGSPTFSAPLFTPGTNNLVLGPGNLGSLTTGHDNTIVGYATGTGITGGNYNLFLGASAGASASSASSNTFIGHNAGGSATGGSNTCIGDTSCQSTSSGTQNTFIGVASGPQTASSAGGNTGVGYGSGNANTSGARNTYLGTQTGNATTTTSDNTYVGYQAGFTCNAASNTILGSSSDCGSLTYTNVIAIGKGVTAGASNSITIGNSSNNAVTISPLNVAGGVVYSTSTGGALSVVPAGTTGQLLQSNGTGAPTWVTVAGVSYTKPTIQKFTSTGTASGYACVISSASVTAGAVYQNNAINYTVESTITSDTLIFFSGTGTLSGSTWTKQSGTGPTTLTSSSCYTHATYTLPTSPSPIYIRIKMAGGGGGGASSGTSGAAAGGAGNPSYFGANLLVANGGGGGTVGGGGTCAGGTTTLYSGPIGYSLTGGTGQGGSNNNAISVYILGGMGGSNEFGGPGGTSGAGSDGQAATGYGGGGGGASTSATSTANNVSGGGGCAGGYVNVLIDSPASTYSYVVGTSGSGASFGTNGHNGGNGAAGVVIVEEYYQ